MLVFGGVNAIEMDRPRHVRVTPLATELRTSSVVRFRRSRMGAVAGGQRPIAPLPSLIEPDVRRYRIRLSDWLPQAARVQLFRR
jgi:hypothetical protein